MTETTLFILSALEVEIFEYFMILFLIVLWLSIFYTILKFFGYISTLLTESVYNTMDRIGLR